MVAVGPLPETGMNENCVLTVWNGLRTICTLDIELLVVVEDAAVEDEVAEPLSVTDDEAVVLELP
jgi:hypothetical protein